MTATNQGVALTTANPTTISIANATEEHLQLLLDQEVAQMMKLDGFDYRPGKIGIMHREKKFITTEGQAVNTVAGTIVYFHKSRGFWEKEGEKIPKCSSLDGKTGQWKISDEETQVCNCANCAKNEYGSDPKGGFGKACKEMRRLFIVEKDSILPVILNIPPTSLKAYDAFMSGLLAKRKAHIAYVTNLRLEGATNAGFDYSKVVLELGDPLPNAKILDFLKMRDQVVAAAANIGIEADDYMNESAAPGTQGTILRDDKEAY